MNPRIIVAGSVSTHDNAISDASPHLTLENLFAVPAPIIEDVIVWVVDTGMPNTDATCSTVAADVSAANPCSGVREVIFIPRVLIILQPPYATPIPATRPTLSMTHMGTDRSVHP